MSAKHKLDPFEIVRYQVVLEHSFRLMLMTDAEFTAWVAGVRKLRRMAIMRKMREAKHATP